MNRKEFKEFLQKAITEQGTMSSSMLPKLAAELLNHIPFVLHASVSGTKQDGGVVYSLEEPQSEINDMIEEALKSEMLDIIVWHKGIAYRMTYIAASKEVVGDTHFQVVGVCYSPGGPCTVGLSKEKGGMFMVPDQNQDIT